MEMYVKICTLCMNKDIYIYIYLKCVSYKYDRVLPDWFFMKTYKCTLPSNRIAQ